VLENWAASQTLTLRYVCYLIVIIYGKLQYTGVLWILVNIFPLCLHYREMTTLFKVLKYLYIWFLFLVFDEDFVFEVTPASSLTGKTLEILLYDFDAFTRHRGLGYVQLPLSSVPDLGINLITIIKPVLRYRTEGEFKTPLLGELMVSISYQLSIEKLTVIVVRARNLPILDDPANANLYVKVCIYDAYSL